jgi:hypothetical protein
MEVYLQEFLTSALDVGVGRESPYPTGKGVQYPGAGRINGRHDRSGDHASVP